ncbi:hypothetical protein Tcan_18678 [Toxocara canis]|uniref:Uncharacterized protein n=1 Tax=Toxocara canis TaxID=6265 RepID=A0A0B2V150_TOXCA|nr:hypothetical protein Tcan_18678 [Toxocara canis]
MTNRGVAMLRSHSFFTTFTLLLLIADCCWSAAVGVANEDLLEGGELPMKEKRLSRHALIKLILQSTLPDMKANDGSPNGYQLGSVFSNGRSPFAEMKFAEHDARRLQRRSPSLFPVLDRRGFDTGDADFQNCFLSPVQCMLPRMRRR